MTFVISLIYCLIELLAAITFFIYFPMFFERRVWVNSRKREIIFILVVAVCDLVIFEGAGMIMDNLHINRNYLEINATLFVITTFIVGAIFFSGKRFTTLLFSVLHLLIVAMIEGLTTAIASFFVLSDLYSAFEGELFMAVMGLANASIRLLLVFGLYRLFGGNRIDYRRKSKIYLFQSLIPVITCLLFITYYTMEFGSSTNPNRIFFVVIVVSLIAINVAHYLSFQEQERIALENYHNQLLQQEYEYKEEYYHNVEKHQEEIRRVKHDLKNQLITIGAYMESTDNSKARDQINLIIQDVLEKSEMNFTRHSGINVLLNTKLKRAQQANITCDFDIKIPENMQFEEREIGSLLGNILDNGIEGCQRCVDKKVIKLQLLYYNHSLILKSENSTDGMVRDLQTRKSNQTEHGLGMKSIELIVDKYNGDWDYSIEDRYFRIEMTLWEPHEG